jgi:hypothetical protein
LKEETTAMNDVAFDIVHPKPKELAIRIMPGNTLPVTILD